MTLDRMPLNAPGAKKPGRCSAWGCPMWAGIKLGSEWVCECHAFADITEWQQVTQRLNQRIDVARGCHKAMHTEPSKGWAHAAMRYMVRIGRPDLIPGKVTMVHPYKDWHTDEFVERLVERDESQHLPLWANRIRATLYHECVKGNPYVQQHMTQVEATGPQIVASQPPEFA